MDRYKRCRGFLVGFGMIGLWSASGAAGQPAGPDAAVVVPTVDFADLRWLEGTWRGRLPDGKFFYERYSLVNDSTFAVQAFADSTLGSSRNLGRVSLRGGGLYREEATGQRVRATRVDSSGVLFGTLERGFTWAPGPGGSWTATIHRSSGSAPSQDVVYRMEPYVLSSTDRQQAVHAAVLDYVDALYDVAPRRIERSVHPELAKRGFWRGEPAAPYDELLMSYDELHALAARWNARGRIDPATAVKDIVVFDVLDQTASAKLTAEWGIDYMHLAMYEGRWKIVNVLWQSPPPGTRP